MTRIVLWLEAWALALGGPGLFLIAFLDSSFLSLPEINDLLVIWMVARNKDLMVYYATMATLGSIVGCLTLYVIGRKGGQALLRRRFSGERVERAMALSRRYGVLAVAIPAILPPPAPFKIFVLLAGVARVPVLHFVTAIAVARGFRYFLEGALAVRYGDQAIAFLEQNGRIVTVSLAALVVIGCLLYVFLRSRRGLSRSERAANP